MADAPDFDAIAVKLCKELEDPWGHPIANDVIAALKMNCVEQLRLVWNARGAADIVKLESELSSMMGVTASGPYVKNLDRALRNLDR